MISQEQLRQPFWKLIWIYCFLLNVTGLDLDLLTLVRYEKNLADFATNNINVWLWVRLNYATSHHHPPAPSTSQNISTSTHHHPKNGPPLIKSQCISTYNLLLTLFLTVSFFFENTIVLYKTEILCDKVVIFV